MDFERRPVFDPQNDFDGNDNIMDLENVTEITPVIFEHIKKVITELLTGEWMTLEELHFHTNFSRSVIDTAIASIDKSTQAVLCVWRNRELEFSISQ